MGLYSYGKSSIFLKVRAYTLYFTLLVLTTVLIIVKILLAKSSNNLEANLMFTYVADCDECVWVCRRNSIVYFYGVLLVNIGWNFPVLFVKGRKLPLRLWLPYDPSSTIVNYYFTFVYIAAATIYNSYSGTIMDPLIGGLAYHATAQLKVLKNNLEHLNKHLDHNLSKRNEHIIEFRCVHKYLESCIDHHKNILWFIDEYEDCFSWSIFCQFAGSMFAVCFCYISLTLVPLNSLEALTYFVLAFNLSFQILFYCHYGTLLYEENNDLSNAIYMGPWYKSC
ncbi:odorant receptor 45b-like [Zophobas morio]|uniref:odorant receptor 45b-like n=1 Tax=Zophobas morio TaxID=2755281 RepID=UPI003082E258